MGTKHHSQGGAYRINLKLDPREDADIIAWLASCPNGQRSAAVREAIRRALGTALPSETNLNLEAIRSIIADELSRLLAGLSLQNGPDQGIDSMGDLEAQYGAKLNRMLGNLSANSTSETDHKRNDEEHS